MTDIRGDGITPHPATGFSVDRVESGGASRKPQTAEPSAEGGKQISFNAVRANLLRVAERAEVLQRNAGAVTTAVETLQHMEETIRFALDAATEAATARSLPDGAVRALQQQIDLAVYTLDHAAATAVAGGAPLFSGAFEIKIEQEGLSLPKLGAQLLGGLAGFESISPAVAESVPYSQSIASIASGGPNSLAFCCDGAADALRAGLGRVREIKGTLERFYQEKILPGVSDIAVTVANALASQHSHDNLDEVYTLIADVRTQLDQSQPLARDASRGQSVLRLLE